MDRKEFTNRIAKIIIGETPFKDDTDQNWTTVRPVTASEEEERAFWRTHLRSYYFRYYVTSDGRYIIAEDKEKVQKLLQDLKAAFPEAKSVRKHEVSYTQGQRYRVTIKF